MKKNKLLLVTLISLPLLAGCGEKTENTLMGAIEYARNHTFEVYGDVYYVFGAGDNQDETLAFKISNIFDTKILANKITYIFELGTESFEQVSENIVFAKDDGNAYSRMVNLSNEVVDVPITDSKDKNVVFEDSYSNPFKNIGYSNFMQLPETESYILKPQISTDFCVNILKQDIKCRKAYLTFDDGKFDYLEIATQSSSSLVSGMSASYRYELRFKWDVHTSEPDVKPYPHYDAHDTLKNALFNLNRKINNHNFTATTNLTASGASVEHHFYATEGNIYSDYADSSNKTYGARKDGNYWYEYVIKDAGKDTQSVTVYSEDPFDGTLVYPQYLAAATELFEPDESGKLFTVYPEFAQAMTYYLAPFTDSYGYAQNISSVAVKLDNSNAFESLIITCSDSYTSSSTATITYSDFGSTELPIIF